MSIIVRKQSEERRLQIDPCSGRTTREIVALLNSGYAIVNLDDDVILLVDTKEVVAAIKGASVINSGANYYVGVAL